MDYVIVGQEHGPIKCKVFTNALKALDWASSRVVGYREIGVDPHVALFLVRVDEAITHGTVIWEHDADEPEDADNLNEYDPIALLELRHAGFDVTTLLKKFSEEDSTVLIQ